MRSTNLLALCGGLLALETSVAFSSLPAMARRSSSALFDASAVVEVNVVDITEGVKRDISGMEEWTVQSGVQRADGVELVQNKAENGDDWSVRTKQDIPTGTPVVFVPTQAVMTSWQAQQEFGSALEEAELHLTEANLADQIPTFRLFVKVLSEYEKGDESPWFPWLNAMPRAYYNGASMTRKLLL